MGTETDIVVDCNTLDACIGKHLGCDGIMSEHPQFSHPIICYALSKLFRAMLVYGYVPRYFGIGIVIPLLNGACLDKTNMDT